MPIQSILQQDSKPLSGSDDQPVPILPGGLDNYEQGQAIGKGGYAVVYRGKRKSDGLFVAIKRQVAADKRGTSCEQLLHSRQHTRFLGAAPTMIAANFHVLYTFCWTKIGRKVWHACKETQSTLRWKKGELTMSTAL